MSAATTLVYGPILVSQRQFPRLNRFSNFKLDISRKFLSQRSTSHCTLIPPIMMDSVENRAAAVSLGGLEQEALIDGSINFSSRGIQATLNSLVSQRLACSVFIICSFMFLC